MRTKAERVRFETDVAEQALHARVSELGYKHWSDLENPIRKEIVIHVIHQVSKLIPDEDREMAFCYTADKEGMIQLAAVPMEEYKKLSVAQASA